MLTMTRVEAIPYESMRRGLPWDWVTYPEFLDSVDRAAEGGQRPARTCRWPRCSSGCSASSARRPATLPDRRRARELRRLLHEAMDAGGCGWSAQRLHPDGPGAVQRDYDGGPMVTDVMHDETALAARRGARRAQPGIHADGARDGRRRPRLRAHRGARRGERPADHLQRGPVVRPASRRRTACSSRGSTSCRAARRCACTGRASPRPRPSRSPSRTGTCSTTTPHGWRRRSGRPAERKAQARRSRTPARASATTRRGSSRSPSRTSWSSSAHTPETKPFENLTVGEVAARTGKHPVDAMLDIAVADDLTTLFYAEPANVNRDGAARDRRLSPGSFPGVSDGGAHTKFFTGGRYPTEFLSRIVREEEMCSLEHAHWRLSALPAHCAGFRDRGTLVEGAPADVVVYDFERLDVPADRGRARRPRRRMAPHPARARLPLPSW